MSLVEISMPNVLTELLAERRVLLADGATGTNLFAMGLEIGGAPESWNLAHPDRVATLHQRFIDAGSDIILSNSFGGNARRLALHDSQDRMAEINEAAARIARSCANAAPRKVLVAGSMGPTGDLFAPLGPLDLDTGTEIFAEQAAALARGGADLLWLETLSSRDEAQAALNGAARVGLPVVCTLSFDTNGRTMMGITPMDFARMCREITPAPHAFGSNCGVGPAEVVAGTESLRVAARAGDLLVAKANCGVPEWVDGAICYAGSPALMAEYARLAVDAGARIVGGCCGTTPEHIRAMRAALNGYTPRAAPDIATIEAALGAVSAQTHGNDATVAPGRTHGRRRRRADGNAR